MSFGSTEKLTIASIETTASGISKDSNSSEELITPKIQRRARVKSGPLQVSLCWSELSAYVPVKKFGFFEKDTHQNRPFKRVLNNVSGMAQPHDCLAILGASGAGKTTLMNILANRAQKSIFVDGEIRVNTHPIGDYMRNISGFVYQEELLVSTLTVLEHLHFMACLKLDRRVTKWERKRRIEELIKEIGLKKCQRSRISNLSGGEKKRLGFAGEVLTDPSLLFCDEPTTGLDSFSARKIVKMMKNLAMTGKTIICTIHQPSSEIFTMFDKICLLAEGRTAYLGSSEGALKFLGGLGFKCPEFVNPADFFIKTLAITPNYYEQGKHNIKKICDAFSASEEFICLEKNILAEIKFDNYSVSSRENSREKLFFGTKSNFQKPLWITQAYLITKRQFINSYRNPEVHTARFLQKFITGLLIGLCYFGITLNQKGIQDIQGAIFIIVTENTFPSMYSALHLFPSQWPIFLRENKNGLYRTDCYYLGNLIAMLPGLCLDPIIFTTLVYWIGGLGPHIDTFLMTILISILTANTASACGMFFSAAFKSLNLAIACLNPFDYLLMVTGGIFVNLSTLPVYISWTKFLSWFMYSNEALSITMWKNVENITCEFQPTSNIPCVSTGEAVLESKSFVEGHFYYDILGLVVIYLSFHIGAFISILIRLKND